MIIDATEYRLRQIGAGGEWDSVRALAPRRRRQLRGGGWLSVRGGYAPDELAEAINDRYGLDLGPCDAVALWERSLRRQTAEARREARRRRETRLAKRAGCRTWWEYRQRLYWSRIGASSVHDYARSVGWR